MRKTEFVEVSYCKCRGTFELSSVSFLVVWLPGQVQLFTAQQTAARQAHFLSVHQCFQSGCKMRISFREGFWLLLFILLWAFIDILYFNIQEVFSIWLVAG